MGIATGADPLTAAAMASSLGQMATTWELGEETGEHRFDTFLVGSFAIAALFLATIGIYGLGL